MSEFHGQDFGIDNSVIVGDEDQGACEKKFEDKDKRNLFFCMICIQTFKHGIKTFHSSPGLAQCAELTWQLRGQAGKRQVEGARRAMQHNFGIGGAAVVTMYEAPQSTMGQAKL